MSYYVPKYFKVHEFVPYRDYREWGEGAWRFIDDRLPRVADWIRSQVGPMFINTYVCMPRGIRDNSGLRYPGSPFYSRHSQHSSGRAFDAVFRNVTAGDVRELIRDRWPVRGLGFSITMEEDVSWLHVDLRYNKELVNFFKA
ncbi:hypothetical protein KAR91_38645 [Candidatus Pacearchaeota archaeon]|nr:hypothetical protein [Candidatus Pacearchaeota archaeon]